MGQVNRLGLDVLYRVSVVPALKRVEREVELDLLSRHKPKRNFIKSKNERHNQVKEGET